MDNTSAHDRLESQEIASQYNEVCNIHQKLSEIA